MLRPLLRAARPRQWIKNLFVGAPLIFAKSLLDGPRVLRSAAAVAIFCMIASAVYLWNDLADVEKDRAHPKKKLRPIASGELPIATARAAAFLLAGLGLVLAALLAPKFAAVAAAYLLLNVLYTRTLKHIPYVDVLVLASFFLLRVAGGALAIDVYASPWIFLCTGLLAAFQGFGKRMHELGSATGTKSRSVLESYRPGPLRAALYAFGLATVVSFLLYALANPHPELFSTTKLVFTLPFVCLGVVRFMMLVSNRPDSESPTEEMLRDPLFVGNLVAWVLAVVAIIYFGR